jgi:hypothetical protein
MLAAQVNARKHDKLRMILGFEWSGGLCFCEALLWWVVHRGCSRWPWFRADLGRLSTPLVCVLAGAEGHPCTVFGSLVGWELAALHSCYVLMLDLCA